MKKRKQYKPKAVVQNPLNYFLGGLKKADSEQLTKVHIKNEMAFLNILQGRGTQGDWDMLSGMQNMAVVLAEIHFDDEYREILLAGRDALLGIGKRYRKIGKFIFTGDEKMAIESIMEVHEAQLNALRVIDIERATNEVQRRLKQKENVFTV